MRKIIVVLVSIMLLVSVISVIYTYTRIEKIVYVDIAKLHDQYKLKNELEQKMKFRLYTINNVLDSMRLLRNVRSAGGSYTQLDTNIARLEYELNRTYEQSSRDITVEVWNRLNPLIEKYGKAHGYSIIVGANGAGTVLYGEKKLDMTEDLIKYVNSSN